MPSRKRILFIGDLHSGAFTGLTPPSSQIKFREKPTSDKKKDNILIPNKFLKLQRESWNWFSRNIDSLKPFHTVAVVGDAIDGTNKKSSGMELLTPKLSAQTKIAAECIRYAEAKNVIVIKGTPYHTREGADEFEEILSDELKAKVSGHMWLDINGVIFDIKHKIGKSAGALKTVDALNLAWAERNKQPRANVFVRAHLHEYDQRSNGRYTAMILPGLQALGGAFGELECSGMIRYGFVYFDVETDGRYTWQPVLADLRGERAHTLKL